MKTKAQMCLVAASSVLLSSVPLVHADPIAASSNNAELTKFLENTYGHYLSLADDQNIVSAGGTQVADAANSERQNVFSAVLKSSLSPQLQTLYSGYID